MTSVLDPANRLLASVDQLANRTSFSYDAASRRVTVQNPLGNVSSTIYNAANWPLATVNPLGHRTSMLYNAAGWQTAVVDANSNRTTTTFDATGRGVATQDALGYLVTQVFDAAGRRVALVDARSNRYTFVWDAANRQVVQLDPLLRSTTFAYNAASEQILRIDARGYPTTYMADELSRPIQRFYPDGSRVTMAYDAVSNRTLLSDSTGSYTTVYDAVNRAQSVTNPANLTITYSYDAASRRQTMIEPFGGIFTYGYSPTNLNTLVVNPEGDRTTWQFDANSRVYLQQLANGIRVSSLYDNADRLTSLANLTSTGTTITSYLDTWDAADNRIARVEQDGTRLTWSYDPTYQLTREQRGGGARTIAYDTTYTYDPAGNRALKIDSGAPTTYAYDASNQLQSSIDATGTTSFAFDANGNQQIQQTPSSGTTTSTWDFENRLIQVALPSGVPNTFTFNGDGLRVRRQDSSGTSKQIWDGQKIVEETDHNNIVQTVYTQSAGVYGDLISQWRSGAANYYLFDPLGSATRLSNEDHALTDTYLYKAFGEALLLAGPTLNRFQFVGEKGYYSDADLLWCSLRERQYNALAARFLSVDPLILNWSANPYLYASNRPVLSVDPSGLVSFSVVSKSNILCGGASMKVVYKPQEFRYSGAALEVTKVCVSFEGSRCLEPAGPDGCCCAPERINYGESCCFYESVYIGFYRSWRERRFEVSDSLDVRASSAPSGCPNTLGTRRFSHEVRVFKLTPGAKNPIRDEWHKEFNNSSVRCHGILFRVHRATDSGAPAPRFWDSRPSFVESGRMQWAVSWNCCCPSPWQQLRWGPKPSGVLTTE